MTRALLVALAVAVLTLGRGRLACSLGAFTIWLVLLVAFERDTFRRRLGPAFWMMAFLLGIAGGLLLGPRDTRFAGIGLSMSGLRSGLTMNVRACVIIVLMSWLLDSLRHRLGARWVDTSADTPAETPERPARGGALAAAAAAGAELLPPLMARMRANAAALRRHRSGWSNAAAELLADVAELAGVPADGGPARPCDEGGKQRGALP